jgi:hypothetical protein
MSQQRTRPRKAENLERIQRGTFGIRYECHELDVDTLIAFTKGEFEVISVQV